MATTQWSLVVAARDGSGEEARRALEKLCRTYWMPLYAFVRHQGWDPEDARDLTQAYFLELLDKGFLADVAEEKGRFRSFLYASLRHFLSHERARAGALKRGGGTATVPLDVIAAESSYVSQANPQMSPENVFEHRWAMTVISRAMSRLSEDARSSGSERRFELLRPYLTSLERHVPYREAGEALGMSEKSVKVAVHRLRKRFGRCLRDELAETLVDRADVDDELRHLLSVVRA
jgi:RNA polymerase sigma factor (sigma-70 family)